MNLTTNPATVNHLLVIWHDDSGTGHDHLTRLDYDFVNGRTAVVCASDCSCRRPSR